MLNKVNNLVFQMTLVMEIQPKMGPAIQLRSAQQKMVSVLALVPKDMAFAVYVMFIFSYLKIHFY